MTRAMLVLLLSLIPLSSAGAQGQNSPDPAQTKRTASYSEKGAETCLRCHSGPEMRAVQYGPHFNLQNPGAPAVDHYCESCHGPGSIHVSRAHGGRGFPPLTEFGRGSDKAPRDEQLFACLQCHEVEGVVRKTIGFLGSPHDRKMINCSTCHTVHAALDPINDSDHQASTCYRCHRKQKTEHPRFEAKSMDIDVLPCSSCHDVHRPLPLSE